MTAQVKEELEDLKSDNPSDINALLISIVTSASASASTSDEAKNPNEAGNEGLIGTANGAVHHEDSDDDKDDEDLVEQATGGM